MSDVILGRLIALPTPETVRRLSDIFSSPPIKLDPFHLLHVTIARAYTEDQVKRIGDVYTQYNLSSAFFDFTFRDVDYIFDASMGVSKLLGEIVSAPMQDLKRLLDPEGPDLSIQFLHNAPPLSRAYKSFVVSVTDTLVYKETLPFTLNPIVYMDESSYLQNFKFHYIGFDKMNLREDT